VVALAELPRSLEEVYLRIVSGDAEPQTPALAPEVTAL
jgi:hypothetical protein